MRQTFPFFKNDLICVNVHVIQWSNHQTYIKCKYHKKILDEGFDRVGKIILVTINLHFREQKMTELFTQKTIQKEQKCFRRSFAES